MPQVLVEPVLICGRPSCVLTLLVDACLSVSTVQVSLRLAQSGLDVSELLVKMGDARYRTDVELAAAAAGASDPLLDALLHRSPYPRLSLPAGVLVPVTVAALLNPVRLLVQPQRVAGEPSSQLRRLAQHLEAIDGLSQSMAEQAESQPVLADTAVGTQAGRGERVRH